MALPHPVKPPGDIVVGIMVMHRSVTDYYLHESLLCWPLCGLRIVPLPPRFKARDLDWSLLNGHGLAPLLVTGDIDWGVLLMDIASGASA